MGSADADLTSKYEVRHQIGKGSFGSAFLVTNKQDRKDYVLKRVRLAKQTKWQRNSTMQERDLVMALQHPFIVPCLESWMVQDHTVNMIYGYCEKGDLSTHLAKVQRMRGQVDEQLMTKWLCQLLLALDYLQTMKVLHRDIKTSNVLLTCDMDAQLGDFGLATMMQEAGDGSKPEDTNLVGTPHYMSPELLSCKDYGFKTDVWSLGCVFYELTAQRPTFNAFNIHGLVSKIKKNKLAPLPDGYSNEWKEVIGLMLCKNPERRPSVQELMGLPQLRPGLLEARARAKAIMPDIKLPPLLNPTPLAFRPLLSGDAAIASDSDNSGHVSSPDRENLDALPARSSEACDSSWCAGAVASQAVQEAEFQEIFRGNSMQQPFVEQKQSQPDEQDEADSDCRLTDRSRCSISSRGSSSLAGSLRGQSATGAASALEAIKRLHQRVRQPGISKMSPAERVAAAIAAARAGKKSPAGAEAEAQLAAAQQPYGMVPAQLSRQSSSNSSSNASGAMRSLARRSCPLGASSRPPSLPLAAPSALTDGGACCSRPASSANRSQTSKAHVSPSPRPAWNAGPAAANGTAGALHRQRSGNNRATAANTSMLKPAAAAAAAGKGGAKGRHAPSTPASHSHYLHQLGQQHPQHKQQQQQPEQAEQGAAVAEQHGPDSVQRLLDTSQELSRRTGQLQQQHAKPPKPQRPAGSAGGVRPPAHVLRGAEQQQQQEEQQDEQRQLLTPMVFVPGVDGSDDEYCRSTGDSAIKKLQFDSASPGSGFMESTGMCTLGRLSDATSEATDVATPQPRTAASAVDCFNREAPSPDILATAQGTSFRGPDAADAAANNDSPVLWGNASTANCSRSLEQLQLEQRTFQATAPGSSGNAEPMYRSSGSPSNSGDMPAATAVAADSSSEYAVEAALSSHVEQRLQLLESVVQLMGGLYAKGRWQEMGNVLCSSSLLPSPVQSAVQTARMHGPAVSKQQSPAGQGLRPGPTCNDGTNSSSSAAQLRTAGQPAEGADGASGLQRELMLGDWVVLGRSKKVKGKIRYIGPVAWDAKGEDWVGMELDTPCGTNGAQQGITYFTCPPRCAAFHRASKLMSA